MEYFLTIVTALPLFHLHYFAALFSSKTGEVSEAKLEFWPLKIMKKGGQSALGKKNISRQNKK